MKTFLLACLAWYLFGFILLSLQVRIRNGTYTGADLIKVLSTAVSGPVGVLIFGLMWSSNFTVVMKPLDFPDKLKRQPWYKKFLTRKLF